jgi:hypothetical protein
MNFKMEFEPTTAFVINAWYTRDIKRDKDKQKNKQLKEIDKCMTELPQKIIDFFFQVAYPYDHNFNFLSWINEIL